FWKITDIFKYYNSGIQTKNDDFVFQYTEKGLEKIVEEITPLYKPEIEKKYNVKDSRDWKIENAKKDLLENYNPRKILYRPFDERFTSLSKVSKGFIGYPRYETAKHFEKENYGLCFTRVVDKSKYQDVLISDKFIDIHATSGQTYIAPLYFYNGVEHSDMLPLEFEGEGMKFANFTADFVNRYLEKIDFEPSPEEILAYIYAVLHSPIYREKYIEFLKTDFPAVPMTTDKTFFRKYAAWGQRLVDLHLLNEQGIAGQARNDGIATGQARNDGKPDSDIRVSFDFEGDFVPVKTETADNRLLITTTAGKTITIDGVTEAIYNFEIGSYRPIEKWLKYRIKDKVELLASDIGHLKTCSSPSKARWQR
ncbi:MAG: hypothetical protein LBR51_03025, partial [Bacteroidales bacterium]|nr:hypothetical protein [Bacteroidales bacterium]